MRFWVEVTERGRLLPHTCASRGEAGVGPSWIYRHRTVNATYAHVHLVARDCIYARACAFVYVSEHFESLWLSLNVCFCKTDSTGKGSRYVQYTFMQMCWISLDPQLEPPVLLVWCVSQLDEWICWCSSSLSGWMETSRNVQASAEISLGPAQSCPSCPWTFGLVWGPECSGPDVQYVVPQL